MVAFQDPRLRQYLLDLVGDEGVRVAEALAVREEATDTELAEELHSKPSHIRKVLYELYEARIAEYQKKKDKETGWITFHWAMTPEQAHRAMELRRTRDAEAIEAAISDLEMHDYFSCPSCESRYDFGTATESDFHCPDHGELLDAVDKNVEIEAMRDKLRALLDVPRADRGNG